MENHAIATMMNYFGSTDHGLGTEVYRGVGGTSCKNRLESTLTHTHTHTHTHIYIGRSSKRFVILRIFFILKYFHSLFDFKIKKIIYIYIYIYTQTHQ